jgi:hypothetical protein
MTEMTPTILHPTLGRAVVGTDTCSKCGHTIPEEHVPLLLWADEGRIMWAYCGACEGPVFALLQQLMKDKTPCH